MLALEPHRHLQPPTHTCRAAQRTHTLASHRGSARPRSPRAGSHHPQLLTGRVFPSEEELTLTRENSIRRLHSHHADPRSQVRAGWRPSRGRAPLQSGSSALRRVWPLAGSWGGAGRSWGAGAWVCRAPPQAPQHWPRAALRAARHLHRCLGGTRVGSDEDVCTEERGGTGAGGRRLGRRLGEDRREEPSPVLTPPPCPGPAAGGECRAESRGPP